MNSKSKAKAFFKSLDMFNQEMTFHTLESNQLNVKSSLGGFVSFSIIVLSILYMFLLIYQWLSGQMLPKVQKNNNFQTTPYTYTFNYSPFMIGVFANNQFFPVNSYEATISVQNNNTNYVSLNASEYLIDCTKVQFQESEQLGVNQLCFNPKSPPISLTFMPFQIDSTQVFVTLQKQQSTESDYEQRNNYYYDEMMAQDAIIQFTAFVYQYDIQTDNLQQVMLSFPCSSDPYLQHTYIIQYTITQVSIDNGWFFQNIKSFSFISDVSVYPNTYTQQYSSLQGFPISEGYVNFQMSLSNNIIQLSVQAVKINEVLASFGAIFNVILMLSNVSKFVSQLKIKRNAFKYLIQNQYCQDVFQYQDKLGIQDNDDENQLSLSDQIDQINKKLVKWRKYTGKRFYTLSGFLQHNFFKKEKDQYFNQLMNQYNMQVDQLLDFETIIKIVYQMKKQIEILLTPQQYAATLYLGQKIDIDKKNVQLNHLDQIESIRRNQQKQVSNLEEFLLTPIAKQTDLDKRILDCLIFKKIGINNSNIIEEIALNRSEQKFKIKYMYY